MGGVSNLGGFQRTFISHVSDQYIYTLNYQPCNCYAQQTPSITVPQELVGKVEQDRWTQFRTQVIAIDQEVRTGMWYIMLLLFLVPFILLIVILVTTNMIYLLGVAFMVPTLVSMIGMMCISVGRTKVANEKLQRLCADFTQDPSDTLCYEVVNPLYQQNNMSITLNIRDPNNTAASATNPGFSANVHGAGNLFAAMQAAQQQQQQQQPGGGPTVVAGAPPATAGAAAGPIHIQCYACQKTFPLAAGASLAICCFCGKENAMPAGMGGTAPPDVTASAPPPTDKTAALAQPADAPPGYYSRME